MQSFKLSGHAIPRSFNRLVFVLSITCITFVSPSEVSAGLITFEDLHGAVGPVSSITGPATFSTGGVSFPGRVFGQSRVRLF